MMKTNPDLAQNLAQKIQKWEIAVETSGPFATVDEIIDLIEQCPAPEHPTLQFLHGMTYGMMLSSH